MTESNASPTQRAYRAVCPNCGAPVEFRSAASASAVCSYCRSTLVRDGDALTRVGESAEVFDDYSPLQVGASGIYQGEPFTLVGRLQMAWREGSWNEWHALFGNGRSGWLSEDNGAFVFAFDLAPATVGAGLVPPLATLRAGQALTLGRRTWTVAAVTPARVGAAQGELPVPPKPGVEFTVVEARDADGEVASLDDSDGPQAPPHVSVGRGVRLADLAMQGLRETSGTDLKGRSFDCPSCGSPLEPRLPQSLTIVCGQCRAVVDLSGVAAADAGDERTRLARGLAHHAQATGGPTMEPWLPLGATGRLALGTAEALPWQVVGYVERCEEASGDDEPQSFWHEYLLFNAREGFVFLVDAEEGWSWVRPLTGAPQASGGQARWDGRSYRQQWEYTAKVTHVLGEFYWRVRRDERQHVTDYLGTGDARDRRLSREAAPDGSEVTWSEGAALDVADIARAFGLKLPAAAADAAPVAPAGRGQGVSWVTVVVLLVVVLLLLTLMSRCSRDDCDSVAQAFGSASPEYQQCLRQRGSSSGRTSGGSWGGYSGGGGHK